MEELAGPAGGPGGQVPGLDQADAQAAGDGVQGRAAAGHSAADDQHVELLRGQPGQRLGPAGRTERWGREGGLEPASRHRLEAHADRTIRPERSGSCRPSMNRTVPDSERIDSEWVVIRCGSNRTPAQQRPVGDPGGGEEHVVAGHQVVGGQLPVEVVAGVQDGGALGVVPGDQVAEHLTAQAAQGAGREHALGRTAGADQQVDPGARGDGHDRAGHVAVQQEPDPRSRRPDRGDQVGVPGPVQDGHRQLAHLPVGQPGDLGQRVADRRLMVDRGGHGAGHHQLVHVDGRAGVEHGAARGDAEHADRVGQALGGEGGAVHRVHRDVPLRARAVADPLAVEQHRGLVLLALADDDDAVHPYGAQHRAASRPPRPRRPGSCPRSPGSGSS